MRLILGPPILLFPFLFRSAPSRLRQIDKVALLVCPAHPLHLPPPHTRSGPRCAPARPPCSSTAVATEQRDHRPVSALKDTAMASCSGHLNLANLHASKTGSPRLLDWDVAPSSVPRLAAK